MQATDIAIVGLGANGRMHAEVLMRREGPARLAAVVVEPVNSARAYAESLGVAWFPDVEALLACKRPDGALIATPNLTHLPLAKPLGSARPDQRGDRAP